VGGWAEGWGSELQQAVRSLVRSPGFSATIVIALGLGIGANTAMFELVDRMLVRPPAHLAEPGSAHRVHIDRAIRRGRIQDGSFSYPALGDLREQTPSARALVGVSTTRLFVAPDDDAKPMEVDAVSAAYWSLFDMTPALGRFFSGDEDELPSGDAVVVLSHGYWQVAYGGDRAVLGRSIRIGTRAYTIVGVAPGDFHGVDGGNPVAWVPLTAAGADIAGPDFAHRPFTTWIELVVRRGDGMDRVQLASELERAYRGHLTAARDADVVAATDPRVLLSPVLRDRGPHRSDAARISLWLFGMSWIVLLVACANVSTLMIGRTLRRRRERAVRRALGMGRGRLVARALLETGALALAAGLVAVPIASGAVRIVARLLLAPEAAELAGLDARSLLVGWAVTALVGLVAGALPALRRREADLQSALRSGSARGGAARTPAQTGLVVAQAALSAVLLMGAGLFLRSVSRVAGLDLGYQPDRVVLVNPEARSPLAEAGGIASSTEERRRTMEMLADAARGIPGVRSVTLTATVPFWRNSFEAVLRADGEPLGPRGTIATHAVSGTYFETMGTRIVRGRPLRPGDDEGAPRVMVVSESLARMAWPEGDALGQCLRVGADTLPCREVVGVAQDIRRGEFEDAGGLQFYVPWRQFYYGMPGVLALRTEGRAADVVEPVRARLQEAVGTRAWIRAQTLLDRVSSQTRTWTVGARVLGLLGSLALLLATLGTFSVVAYDVSQRTREFGIRMAVGARGRDLVTLVLRKGVAVAAVGVALGLGLAWIAGPSVQGLLFEVPARDPATFLGVAVLLLWSALAASLLPALASARVDPRRVLRSE
jgi:predicted permease